MTERTRVTWREATIDDARTVWRWRNDAASRRASYEPGRVAWRDHQVWFRRKLDDDRSAIWIARAGGDDVGQVRLDAVAPGVVEVAITVAPQARGRGVGTAMLASLPPLVKTKRWRRCRAWVKADNVDSAVAFLRAGFRMTRCVRHRGVASYLFESLQSITAKES